MSLRTRHGDVTMTRREISEMKRSNGRSWDELPAWIGGGTLAGLLVGSYIGAHKYGGADLSGALGRPVSALMGLVVGAVSGTLVGVATAPEQWMAVRLPWRR